MNQDNELLLQQLIDIVKDLQKFTQDLDKKIDLHIQKAEMTHEQNDDTDETLEERLVALSKEVTELKKAIDTRLKPLEKPLAWLKTTGKIFFGLASTSGAIYGIMKFIEFLGSK